MREISTSISSFEAIIDGGYAYVDKTSLIYDLLVSRPGHYFLARPRRFGKSLLVSTLEMIFKGRRELFAETDISRKDYAWPSYPVLRFDFGNIGSLPREQLRKALVCKIDFVALSLGVDGLTQDEPALRFEQLILLAGVKAQSKVVLLIDEYDKPILEALNRPELPAVVEEMRNFYATIKTMGDRIHFSFMTGVSKFSKVSIFSGINNLQDLTMDAGAATLLGYTKTEIVENFQDRIDALRYKLECTFDEAMSRLERFYDGYRFHPDSVGLYNPVSIGNCLNSLEFKNYWFSTGTPTFLLEILKRRAVDFEHLDVGEDSFQSFEPESPDPISILFQTGYLSLKSAKRHDSGFNTYQLGFPNLEVEKSLSNAIVWDFSGIGNGDDRSATYNGIKNALRSGDLAALMAALKSLFANVPYNLAIQKERYYQTIFYLAMLMMNYRAVTEDCTNVGRIDMTVETPERIYIFEFKLDGGAEAALEQIKSKRYAEKHLRNGKEIVLLGVSFGRESRNINEWKSEILKEN